MKILLLLALLFLVSCSGYITNNKWDVTVNGQTISNCFMSADLFLHNLEFKNKSSKTVYDMKVVQEMHIKRSK